MLDLGDASSPKAALLVVDVQTCWYTNSPLVRTAFPHLPEKLEALLALARRRGLVPSLHPLPLRRYSSEMTRLLAANPGLKSRFPTTIGFDDYAADELMAIADGMMRDEALELDADARAALMGVFERMAAVHDRENGNGRAVRNLLERAKREQALRLMGVPGRKTKEEARPRPLPPPRYPTWPGGAVVGFARAQLGGSRTAGAAA